MMNSNNVGSGGRGSSGVIDGGSGGRGICGSCHNSPCLCYKGHTLNSTNLKAEIRNDYGKEHIVESIISFIDSRRENNSEISNSDLVSEIMEAVTTGIITILYEDK